MNKLFDAKSHHTDTAPKTHPAAENSSLHKPHKRVHRQVSTGEEAHIHKEKMHFFSTYCELPNGVTFKNQETGEEVLLLLRRHMITNITWVLISIFLLLLPVVTPFVFDQLNVFALTIPLSLIIMSLSFYYVIVAGYVLLNFLSWFYNISLITKKEVVDIEYSHITHKNIASANLESIQDTKYRQGGFLKTFFNYGDVFVQTAGAKPNIEFMAVPNPGKVTNIISDEMKGLLKIDR